MTIFLNPACGACDCTGTVTIGRAYVVGTFTTVNGTATNYIVMLDADGAIVTTFVCTLNDWAEALVLDETNGVLWIGGSFTTVNGVTCKGLVGVNWNTGATLYNPVMTGNSGGLAGNPEVLKLAMDSTNGHLYVAGSFRKIGGLTQAYCARFTLSTGAFDATFAPLLDSDCYSAKRFGSLIYLVGAFVTIGGVARNGVGAVSALGALDAWYPNLGTGGPLDVMPVSASSIFLTGSFNTSSVAHARLCEVDASAAITTWAPGGASRCLLGSNPRGQVLAPFVSTNFLCGGTFTGSDGVAGNLVAFFYAGADDTSFQIGVPVGSNLTTCEDVTYAGDGRVYAAFSGNGKGARAYGADGLVYTGWAPSITGGNCYAITTSQTEP